MKASGDRQRSALYEALEAFGRKARELSVTKLSASEAGDTLLRAVASDAEVDDAGQRQALAERVNVQLQAVIAAIKDPVDRRIAQAILASEPEFHGQNVSERQQYVRESDRGFTDEQYKSRRAWVIEEVSVALVMALKSSTPRSQQASQSVSEPAAVPPPAPNEQFVVGDAQDQSDPPRARWFQRRHVAVAGGVVVLVVAIVIGLALANGESPKWNGMTATELERRYDGKLPMGEDEESRCADKTGMGATINPGQPYPALMGPDGTEVAKLQLRQSAVCPTAVWIRVLWQGSEWESYQIPPGWTLHTVMHRAATNTTIEETDPASPWPLRYILSKMVSSANGCVYGEAYFVKDAQPDIRTPPTRTVCVQV